MRLGCSFVFALGLIATVCSQSANMTDRGANAANVTTAGLIAASGAAGVTNGVVPYLSSSSYMTSAFGVLGGVIKIYQGVSMDIKLTRAINDMNSEFDSLNQTITKGFQQMESFADMKQVETDIIDPLNILWGELTAYIVTHDRQSWLNLVVNCQQDTAWQIATRIDDRLNGPDNTLWTWTVNSNYDNKTFMAAKDVFIYRIFQAVMVEAFCVGAQKGPDYNITQDYYFQRIYSLYTNVVNNTIATRVKQETEYLSGLGSFVDSVVTSGSNNANNFKYYSDTIWNYVSAHFSWDKFIVVINEKNCYQSGETSWYPPNPTSGNTPYATWTSFNSYPTIKLDVYVFRYWPRNDNIDYSNEFANQLTNNYNKKAEKWAYDTWAQGRDFSLVYVDSDWWCGDTAHVTYDTDDGVFSEYKDGYNGWGCGLVSASQRPGTVTHDLGFYERYITVQLMPYNS